MVAAGEDPSRVSPKPSDWSWSVVAADMVTMVLCLLPEHQMAILHELFAALSSRTNGFITKEYLSP